MLTSYQDFPKINNRFLTKKIDKEKIFLDGKKQSSLREERLKIGINKLRCFKAKWVVVSILGFFFAWTPFEQLCSRHSMARVNLNKSEEVVTNTTTASKYIPKRSRICINWNPPFQTSLHKIFKNCFLWSKSYFTTLTFRGTFTK